MAERVKCAHPDCEKRIGNNKFAKIRAGVAGWYFSRKDGTIFCPKHVPEWVKEWRKYVGEHRIERR